MEQSTLEIVVTHITETAQPNQDTITEPAKTNGKFKEYDVSNINKSYLESFQSSKYPDLTDSKQRMSFNQYRCTLNNFLETLTKDAAMTKREDIDNFLSNTGNSKNKASHIKSFFIYLITTNYKNIQSKVSRDLLVKLLEM
jgi:hypothetical protein